MLFKDFPVRSIPTYNILAHPVLHYLNIFHRRYQDITVHTVADQQCDIGRIPQIAYHLSQLCNTAGFAASLCAGTFRRTIFLLFFRIVSPPVLPSRIRISDSKKSAELLSSSSAPSKALPSVFSLPAQLYQSHGSLSPERLFYNSGNSPPGTSY